MKKTIGFVLALMLSFSGCRKTPEPTPEPKPEAKREVQSFVPPQTGPTANAPNGIAIVDGTVVQPTVNNLGKPSRHLTESQKTLLIASLKRISPQSFYFLSAPDAESTQFGNEVLNVLTSPKLEWRESDLPSNLGQATRLGKGLFVVVSGLQRPPQVAARLQQAFKRVGIDANGLTYPMVGADRFAVYVGVNPASD